MEQQTFEGTWEEILLHASELAGRHVKVTVLEHETSHPPSPQLLDKVLQGRVGRVCFQPANLSEQPGEAFADLMIDKHQPSELIQ